MSSVDPDSSQVVIDGPVDERASADDRVYHHLTRILDEICPRWDKMVFKGGRYRRELHGPGQFVLKGRIEVAGIAEMFALPEYIKVDETGQSIFCERCWCEIVGDE